MQRFSQALRLLLSLAVFLLISSCGLQITDTGNPSVTNELNDNSHEVGNGTGVGTTPTTIESLVATGDRSISALQGIGQLASPTASLDMKLLIISATEEDSALGAAVALMKQVGVPYDLFIAKDQTLTEDLLTDGTQGNYQGIILTSSNLPYQNSAGQWVSGLDPAEWQILWSYESAYAVRQLTLYTFPSIFPEDYGIKGIDTNGDGWADGNSNETTMTLTSEGQDIFSSLKPNASIPLKHAYTYPSTLDTTGGVTATPILRDSAGNILGVVSTSTDGRERMALTMGHNQYLLHTQLLGYDMLRWVTQGVFIGERRMYLSVDIDDLYLESDVWNPATLSNFSYEEMTYRVTASDIFAARDGVLDLRERFNAPYFNYTQVFNSLKGDPDAIVSCDESSSLSDAFLCFGTFFNWVSHTFSHANMTPLNYEESREEIEKNLDFAESQAFEFDRKFLVTGRHSGLGWKLISAGNGQACVVDQVTSDEYCQFGLENGSNAEMLRAAVDLGIEYLAANRGWDTHTRQDGCDTCLIVHPLNSSIKLIPRWPTNIFYNTTTPTENTSEFNYLYGPNGLIKDGFGNAFYTTDQTWQQVLQFEAEMTMRHILSFSPYPHFFHQNDLREYAPGRSLMYDWSEAVLSEYSKYFATPIISQDWEGITTTLENRTSFFEGLQDGSISGIWNRQNNTVNVSSTKAATVYVTGAEFASGDKWTYGPDKVSRKALSAGQSVSGSVSNTFSYTAPTITTARATATGVEGQTVTMNWTVNNPNNTFLGWSATNLPPGLAINPATGTITGTYACDSAGTYNTTVFASDNTIKALHSLSWTVSADASANCTQKVATFYADSNYLGTTASLTVGEYARIQNGTIGIANDTLSSLKVTDGYTVELYQHYNFGGEKQVFTSDTPTLANFSFDNTVSSAKIYKTPVPTTLYVDGSYQGAGFELEIGEYNWLPNAGVPNDAISRFHK